MRLFGVAANQCQPGAAVDPAGTLARRNWPSPPDQPGPEVLADQRNQPVVIHIAGGRDDHPLRGIAPQVKRLQLSPRHHRHGLRAADHRATDRVVAEQRRQEHVRQGVLGVVVAHRDLLEDDVTFHLDIVGGTAAVEHHIGDQVDGQRQVAAEHVGVVAGVLLGGECVQFPAHRVHRLRNVHGRAGGRRLEQQMLKEVRRPGHRGAFVARSDADPHPDRRGVHRGQEFGDHSQPARQGGAPRRQRRRGVSW
ncbi:Uncharacterised protein [Mycobacterium tuberculosis]|nr:Uncharacterised protein [Mycobacterium tuberculosis]CNL64523.1 Uncharacterised protein [Mycobacterium tuberculosis]